MFLAAFVLGLLGSFHCIGMCGPVAFMLPLNRKDQTKRWLEILSYHLGRILMYGLLGSVFGLLGQYFQIFGFQQYISIAIGVIMIVMLLLPRQFMKRLPLTPFIYKCVGKLKKAIGLQLKTKRKTTFFTLGFLNGLLPCGLVYMAVFGAVANTNSLNGAFYMMAFGLGTVPLMTPAIYLGNFLKQSARQYILKYIPIFVFIIGVFFILRGLGLGIPYVSPSTHVAVAKAEAQHACH